MVMTPDLLGAFMELRKQSLVEDAYTQQSVQAALVHLTIVLLRALESNGNRQAENNLDGQLAARVGQYLRQHFHEPLTLTSLGRALHFSPNYLGAIYKQETGTTILETLTQIRLEEATRLLLQERMSVKRVAQAVGYNSPEHFSRIFKRVVGVAPSLYGHRNQ